MTKAEIEIIRKRIVRLLEDKWKELDNVNAVVLFLYEEKDTLDQLLKELEGGNHDDKDPHHLDKAQDWLDIHLGPGQVKQRRALAGEINKGGNHDKPNT